MKKIILAAALALLCAAPFLNAIPANPRKFTKIQPNGTAITLQRHGDEFYHWTTDEHGRVVSLDEKGNYVLSALPDREHLGGRQKALKDAAAIRARRSPRAPLRTNTPATYHFPVILVQFKDKKFTSETADQDFYHQLNEPGYSDNNATGSVHDYYLENSMGAFNAEFHVYGPYTYDGTYRGFYNNDSYAAIALWDVISTHDDDIDWSIFDNDGDGVVDMVFMYYAGWSAAEGDDYAIWPHKWNFAPAGVSTSTLDTKEFDIYACSSELFGNENTESGMCGIGACTHEFAHTQGLPDFYDVNYFVDGSAGGTYSYDVMCEGGYNNFGRTPPYFNAQERVLMGWLDGFTELPASGSITIPSVDSNFGGMMMTDNTSGDGEFFIFECRSGKGWDAPLKPGLLVYHVDKSTRYSSTFHNDDGSFLGTWNGYQLWHYEDEYINANSTHPYFYIVPAADETSLCYPGADANLPFPGGMQITRFIPVDWDGYSYGLFSDIAFNENGDYHGESQAVVTMTRTPEYHGIMGRVMNSFNEPIAGAKVSLYQPNMISIPMRDGMQLISGRVAANLLFQTTTDAQGCYSIEVPSFQGSSLEIEVIADGYLTKYEPVSFKTLPYHKDVRIRRIGEPVTLTLKKYTALTSQMNFGFGSDRTTVTAALSFTSEELLPYVGRRIIRVGFIYSDDYGSRIEGAYGLVDVGKQRNIVEVERPVANDWSIADFSGQDLYIEADKEYHFGYALINSSGYPIVYSTETTVDGASEFYYFFENEGDSWKTSSIWWDLNDMSWATGGTLGNLMIYVELEDKIEVDYNSIANPGYGNYTVGDEFALVLNEAEGARKPGTAIQWFYDDEPVSGSSVQLKYPGRHVVEARFTTTEGKTKVVELELNVQP